MNRLKNISLFLHLESQVVCIGILLFLVPLSLSSQNYVSPNTEMSIMSSVDLSSSPSWSTNRSSTPGYFTWLAGSENYEGSSDAFHVDGYVKKIGNTSFTFPVGSGSDLRTLQISAPSTITSEYAVAWISGDPTVTPDPTNTNQYHSISSVSGNITAVSPVGQWDWLPINGAGDGLIITVSLPGLSGNYFTNAADVRLIGWNGTSWVSLGTSGASGLTENSLLSGTMIAGIRAIGIGSIKSVVPPVAPPVYVVAQNIDGSLSVSGTATAGLSLLITFPDGSTKNTIANAQGQFGPIDSDFPQVMKSIVKVVATNVSGVSSIEVLVSYEFEPNASVSEAFTPNGDGINDTWMIYQLDKYPNTTVRVFNRWGSEVYSSTNYQNDWDGHFNNTSSILPQSSSYYYQIDFGSNGTLDKQGWLYIRR